MEKLLSSAGASFTNYFLQKIWMHFYITKYVPGNYLIDQKCDKQTQKWFPQWRIQIKNYFLKMILDLEFFWIKTKPDTWNDFSA